MAINNVSPATSSQDEWQEPITAANDSAEIKSRASITDYRVCKSHILARATNTLSLIEYRILTLAISKVDSTQNEKQKHCLPFTWEEGYEREVFVLADDYKKLCQLSSAVAGHALSQSVDHLRDQKITSKNELNETINIPIIENIDYANDSRYLGIQFTPEFFAEIVNLNDRRRHNINYSLGSITNFRSMYSFKLYEYLLSQQNGPKELSKHVIPVREFQKIMNYPKTYGYDQVRRTVIQKAIDDINKIHDKAVECTPIKSGKKVVILEFWFIFKNPR